MLTKIKDSMVKVQQKTVPATSSALTVSGTCAFYGISIRTDGTNDITLNLYDSLAASGVRLLPSNIIIYGVSGFTSISFETGILCDIGIYVSTACTGTYEYQVYYDKD